jgi:hypothetical protein
MPWYLARYCGAFIASWLFQQSLLVVVLVIAGGIVAALSRFGGILTLLGFLIFLMTISLPFSSYIVMINRGTTVASGLPCSEDTYGILEPYILHTVGAWFAVAGAIVSFMGASWTVSWFNPSFLMKKATSAIKKRLGVFSAEKC